MHLEVSIFINCREINHMEYSIKFAVFIYMDLCAFSSAHGRWKIASDGKSHWAYRLDFYVFFHLFYFCQSRYGGDVYVVFQNLLVCADNVNMEGSLASSGDVSGDTVAWSGRLKPFLSYRTRYSALSSVKEHSGSNCSLASITGGCIF